MSSSLDEVQLFTPGGFASVEALSPKQNRHFFCLCVICLSLPVDSTPE